MTGFRGEKLLKLFHVMKNKLVFYF